MTTIIVRGKILTIGRCWTALLFEGQRYRIQWLWNREKRERVPIAVAIAILI